MPKSRRKIDPDSRQMSLLDYIQQARAMETRSDEGTLNIRESLRALLNRAFKNCPKSRWEVSGEMSHLLGLEITKYMLDAWTAESKEGHRMPAEYLPAFCVVTGCYDPIVLMDETAGRFSLPGPDALRGEIQRFRETEKKARAERLKRERFLKEMEG